MKYQIIVHGGAWDIPVEHHEAHRVGVEKAVLIGQEALKNGASAMDACIAAVEQLENDPTFDAGVGAFLNDKGEVELDAIVMNGEDLSIGSVAGVQCIKNPVHLANKVRLETEHALLVAQGAQDFAKKSGIEIVDPSELLVGRELERYEELLKEGVVKARKFFDKPSKMGTVGAVAIDQNGKIACATSTGGTPNKMAGRVGDSPIPGSGAYANKFAGASTTGWGESIMKVVLAKSAVDAVKLGKDAQSAADFSIQELDEIEGLGGIILIDHNGDAVFSYNTPYMARAIANQDGLQFVGV